MKKPVSKIIDYLALSFLVSAAIIGVLLFNGNQFFQILTVISLSLIYIFWGIIHHLKDHTLHPKIILEYIVFAILGTVLVIGLY